MSQAHPGLDVLSDTPHESRRMDQLTTRRTHFGEIPPKVTTMSSREIAELTGKEHKNALADIRAMLEALGQNSAEFSAQYRDSTGRNLPCFNLPKDLTITLVSGYSVVMRHRIVTRWQELEAMSGLRFFPGKSATRYCPPALPRFPRAPPTEAPTPRQNLSGG